MQTALKQAGMVKDMYQEQLKEMQTHAQLMHYIASALVGMARVNEEERHHEALEDYLTGKIAVENYRLGLEQQLLQEKERHDDILEQNFLSLCLLVLYLLL